MQSSHTQWIFTLSPSFFKTSAFESRYSVAPTQICTNRNSDYTEVAPTDNLNPDDANFPVTSLVKSKLITSTSNQFVKHCLKLRNNSSYRRSHGSAVVVGATPIREIYKFQDSLRDSNVKVDYLILPAKAEIPKGLEQIDSCILRVSATVMKKLSGLQSTDSIDAIALMKIPSSFFDAYSIQNVADCQRLFASPHRILVLDGIQDPGNLGTLLRSAVAFRWDGVFLLPGCCDPFNEKALRASRGASFQLPIVSGSWNHLESLKDEFQMRLLAGYPKHEGAIKPVSLLSPSFCGSVSDSPLCLILGSEGSGLSGKSLQACELVSIPMSGEFESLNVSVAGGIFLYMLQPNNR